MKTETKRLLTCRNVMSALFLSATCMAAAHKSRVKEEVRRQARKKATAT